MKFKAILNEVIEEEISKLEQMGEKVRLKKIFRNRIICSIVFGLLLLGYIGRDEYFTGFVILIIYFVLLYRLNNAQVVSSLAKKHPNMPISEIIKGEMR